ncbi:MAG: ATPase, partial [Hyphomicrobium sp.]
TRVEVAIANALLRRDVEKNLDEWLKSPVSLLFFKNIRRLQIGDKGVHWDSFGPGPIANSEWMALDEKADEPFLLVRSAEEAFPADALDEIRQERMLGAEDGGDFPPCRIEIVLGAKGRLYVVLPTGVETALPFACNAPFIQDPARLKIKDPETSPTNRWLLNRAGQLAADAMVQWLEQTKTSPLDRAMAYGLLPDVDREATTLEGSCGAIVELAFAESITDRPILLTEEGDLVAAKSTIIVPLPVFEIWPAEQAMALLDKKSRPALCRHISAKDRTKLVRWDMVDDFTKADLLDRLRTNHLPRPATWRHLLNLWAYIAPEVTGYQCRDADQLRIVPVQGKEVLYSASEVVRLGEKKLLQSDGDWEFLSAHLIVLNQNWTRFLAEQRREKVEGSLGRGDLIQAAFAVLEEIGLNETSDINTVIEQVAADYFGSSQPKMAECVQIAQIAAKLGATVGESFRFACADRKLRPIAKTVLFDDDGALEDLLPDVVRQTQLLHSDYVANFTSCSGEDWQRWVGSGRSGLQTFAPFVARRGSIYSRIRLLAEAQARGLRGALYYPYVTDNFAIEDWDFEPHYWKHWEAMSATNPGVWAKVAARILGQRDSYWSRFSSARKLQIATTGSARSVTSDPLLAEWLLKLREKPCLPDTRDVVQLPSD